MHFCYSHCWNRNGQHLVSSSVRKNIRTKSGISGAISFRMWTDVGDGVYVGVIASISERKAIWFPRFYHWIRLSMSLYVIDVRLGTLQFNMPSFVPPTARNYSLFKLNITDTNMEVLFLMTSYSRKKKMFLNASSWFFRLDVSSSSFGSWRIYSRRHVLWYFASFAIWSSLIPRIIESHLSLATISIDLLPSFVKYRWIPSTYWDCLFLVLPHNKYSLPRTLLLLDKGISEQECVVVLGRSDYSSQVSVLLYLYALFYSYWLIFRWL